MRIYDLIVDRSVLHFISYLVIFFLLLPILLLFLFLFLLLLLHLLLFSRDEATLAKSASVRRSVRRVVCNAY